MIKFISLNNFRQHTSLEVGFSGGLNVIRGSNEGGKSTIFEAIGYALFGAKVLRDSLESCVTWGQPVGSLKVLLTFQVQGVEYKLSRGKSGAEVNYAGGIVTGQTEVTAFAAKLLGVDASTAAKLTTSNQTEIRGALEAGPKATTELIERLAEFDQIDLLIEAIQGNLALGTTAIIELNIEAAEEAVANLQGSAIEPDEGEFNLKVMMLESGLLLAESSLMKAKAVKEAALEQYLKDQRAASTREGLSKVVERSQGLVNRLQSLLLKELPQKVEDFEGEEARLNNEIQGAELWRVGREAFNKGAPFFTAEPKFKGNLEALERAIEGVRSIDSKFQLNALKLANQVKLQTLELTQGTCTFCGKDFSGVPEVALKNADITMQIEAAKQLLATEARGAENNRDILKDLQEVMAASQPALKVFNQLQSYFTLQDETMPPTLVWKGPPLSNREPDIEGLRSALRGLKVLQREYTEAVAQRNSNTNRLHLDQQALDEALEELSRHPEVSLEVSAGAHKEAERLFEGERETVQAVKDQLGVVEKSYAYALKDYQRALEKVKESQERLADYVKELEERVFNNGLLKKVRQCRPAIADRLWGIVLSAVSSYFSEVRGVPSLVSKDSDGFKVDGHPVSSLSGSTLDALGLSIRVALVRTFLPNTPFLILDEPGAAMDSARTNSMLGFLASCGFGQILLVTHEEVSSEVADNIITL